VIISGFSTSPEEFSYRKGELLLEFSKAIRESNCEVALFPETAITGFYPDREELYFERGSADSPFMKFSQLAKETETTVVAGIAEARRGSLFNSALVFELDGTCSTTYDKRHPFDLAGEGAVITPGVQDPVFRVGSLIFSLRICFDLRFPEDFHHRNERPDAVIVLANWPSSRRDHWETLLKARAIEGELNIIGINRSGTDDSGQNFDGSGLAFNPLGIQYENLSSGKEGEFIWDVTPRNEFKTVGRTGVSK
jgi:predicted amidohydrolase